MTANEYLASMGLELDDGWKTEVAQRNGEDVAVMVIKGPEIHFVSLKEKFALTRRIIHYFLAPIVEEHGYATTRVPIEITDHKLRHTLGFTQTWADDRFTYWAMTELPFGRKTCQ